ncbi:MAG TPA: hypothetical protein PKC98_14105 [Candidatus Melainabacteria bacterium]|nr:hypothetical protein [Candidatus Melainabacteria bacterium]
MKNTIIIKHTPTIKSNELSTIFMKFLEKRLHTAELTIYYSRYRIVDTNAVR